MIRSALFGVGVLFSALVLAAHGTGSAASLPAQTSSSWAVSTSYPAVPEYLGAAACTAGGLAATCVTVGFSDSGASVLSSTDGGQEWVVQTSPPSITGLSSVSCASTSQCVAVGDSYTSPTEKGAVATTTNSGALWVSRIVPTGVMVLDGVACPSLQVCFAVGSNEMEAPVILSSTNGGINWVGQTVPSGIEELAGVSCLSPSNCEAVGSTTSITGAIIGTTDGGAIWSVQRGPAGTVEYDGVDCMGSSTCVAVGSAQGALGYPSATAASTSNNGSTWSASSLPAGVAHLDAISCATSTVCVATGTADEDAGYILGTSNGGASWTAQAVPSGVAGLTGVACASTTVCTAAGFDHAGHYAAAIVTTVDGGGTWSAESTPTALSSLEAVSCADLEDCTAVGYGGPGDGVTATTSDGAGSWSVQSLPAGVSNLYGVSCALATDCVAVGAALPLGAAIVSTSGGDGAWVTEPVPSGNYVLSAVSCPGSTEDCVAVGYTTPPMGPGSGVVLVTTNGGSSWSMESVPAGVTALYGISCPDSTSVCEAVGSAGTGAVVLGTTDGVTWTEQGVPARVSVLRGIACPNQTTCYAVGWSVTGETYGGAVVATTKGGTNWTAEILPSGVAQLTSVSCVTATGCEAVGTSSSGGVAVVATEDGLTWSEQPTPSGKATMAGVSCVASATELCIGTGSGPSGVVLLSYSAPAPVGTSSPQVPVIATATMTASARPYPFLGQSEGSNADWTSYLDGGEHTSYNAAATSITPSDISTLHLAWRWLPPASPDLGPASFLSSPVVTDGVVYVGAADGYLFAVDEVTHQTLWSDFLGLDAPVSTCGADYKGFVSTATVTSNPATGQETVYDNAGNGWLYALDALSGAVEWKALVDVPDEGVDNYYSWGSPLVANGRVYVGISSDCDTPLVPAGVVAFDESTGAQLAEWDSLPPGQIGASVWSTPAVAPNGDIFADTGNGPANVQNLYSESIVRLDPGNLQLLDAWQVPASQRISDGDFGGSPTIFTGDIDGTETPMVGACNKDGYFYAFAQDDLSGGPVWQDQLVLNSSYGNECDASPMWDGTELIEGTAGLTIIGGTKYPGAVEALNPATGATVWQAGLPGAIVGSPAEDGGGVLSAPTWISDTMTPGVYLFNASTGVILGLVRTGGPQFGQGVFSGDDLVVACGSSSYGVADYQVASS